MKTVILAGGYGSRIPEYTNKIPKPMIKIGGVPLLTHIMRFFKSYGFDEFLVAGGYKYSIIRDYFITFDIINIISNSKRSPT